MINIVHQDNGQTITEVLSDSIIINSVQDALELMMNLTQDSDSKKMIMHKENIHPDFFLLHTGFAGEILQKFVNYKFQLAIVGNFKEIASDSLRAFIVECNRGRQIFYLDDVETAKQTLFKVSL